MKTLIAVMAAVVVAFAFATTPSAGAEQCQPLITQFTERVDKLPDHSFKKGMGQRAIAAAQKLHDEGKQADCVALVEEAVRVVLGH